MLAIQTILHPTDFSERSEYAFRLACSLARDHDAKLVLAHIVPTPQMVAYGEMPLLAPQQAEGFMDSLNERIREMRGKETGIVFEEQLIEGEPATEIVRLARELPADLVVMGTHGRTGLGRLLMGSVAEQVMRKAPCPVLTVKAPARVLEVKAEKNPALAVK
jgi:nucleotide-binding universal stress UspA family protein